MVKKTLGLFVIFIVTLTACGNNSDEYTTKNFIAMDTFFSITIPHSHLHVTERLQSIISTIEKDFLVESSEGDIGKINNASGVPIIVNDDTKEWISDALIYAKEMNGYYDPSIEIVNNLWDFNLRIKPNKSDLNSALELVDYNNIQISNDNTITVKKGMKLGGGAIAKGFAVRKQLEVLSEEGIQQALLSAGGNMYALGTNPHGEPWKIDIQHPREPNEIIGYVLLKNLSIDTAGDYEKYFEIDQVRYHHILNPKTGYSDSDLISVTVICEDPAQADAYSTGILAMGLENAKNFTNTHPEIGVVLIDKNLNIYVSENAKKSFTPVYGNLKYF